MPEQEVTEEQLRKMYDYCRLEYFPTPFTYRLRKAVNGDLPSNDILTKNWYDKPHRVVFDACREIEKLSALVRYYRLRSNAKNVPYL
jgi:hypothetical protein